MTASSQSVQLPPDSVGYPRARQVYGLLAVCAALALAVLAAMWSLAPQTTSDPAWLVPAVWLAVLGVAVATAREAHHRLCVRYAIHKDVLVQWMLFPRHEIRIALGDITRCDADLGSPWSDVVVVARDGIRIRVPGTLLFHRHDFRSTLIQSVQRRRPNLTPHGGRARWGTLRERWSERALPVIRIVGVVCLVWMSLAVTHSGLGPLRSGLRTAEATVTSVSRYAVGVRFIAHGAEVEATLITPLLGLGAPSRQDVVDILWDPEQPTRIYTTPPLGGWAFWLARTVAAWLLSVLALWVTASSLRLRR
jgi:hypothetical protein